MKKQGKYIKAIMHAIERAGFDLVDRNSSHYIYGKPGRPHVSIPSKLDDRKKANRIAKRAGVTLDA